MPVYTNAVEMVEAIRAHAREMHHEILKCDTASQLTLGFSCADCTDPDTIWECGIRAVKNIPLDNPLRKLLSGNRDELLAELNSFAENPFFNGDGDFRSDQGLPEITTAMWGSPDESPLNHSHYEAERNDYEQKFRERIPNRFDRVDPTDESATPVRVVMEDRPNPTPTLKELASGSWVVGYEPWCLENVFPSRDEAESYLGHLTFMLEQGIEG